jgi:MFS superfamily sulfate permease-like transporter
MNGWYVLLQFYGGVCVAIISDSFFNVALQIMSRHKMMILEYAVCLFTFVAIQYVGIEVGMLMGILGAMANFVYSYAKKSNVTITALRFSTAVRTFEV